MKDSIDLQLYCINSSGSVFWKDTANDKLASDGEKFGVWGLMAVGKISESLEGGGGRSLLTAGGLHGQCEAGSCRGCAVEAIRIDRRQNRFGQGLCGCRNSSQSQLVFLRVIVGVSIGLEQ